MQRTIRNAVVAVLTAAVAFGVTAPVAAAPKDKTIQVKTHGKAKTITKKSVAAQKKAAARQKAAEKRAPAAARKAAAQRTQVLRDIDRRIAMLDRAVAGDKLAGLSEEVVTTINANVATDRSALTDIRTSVAGGQDLGQVRVQLHGYRVETYNVVVGLATEAVAVTTEAGLNDAALDELALTGVDATDARAVNAAAVAAADSAMATALLLTATSSVHDRAGAEADLATARELLDTVAAFRAAPPAVETDHLEGIEPVLDEPVFDPVA